MTPWALVTPASRGIGFALTRHLLRTTNIPIIATARERLDRTKEKLLDGLPDVDPFRLNILRVDVTGECHPIPNEMYELTQRPRRENYPQGLRQLRRSIRKRFLPSSRLRDPRRADKP